MPYPIRILQVLRTLDEEKHLNDVFFKERWINENEIEQRLIVSYSPKYKQYWKDPLRMLRKHV